MILCGGSNVDFQTLFTRYLRSEPIPKEDEKAIRMMLRDKVSQEFQELANQTVQLSQHLKKQEK